MDPQQNMTQPPAAPTSPVSTETAAPAPASPGLPPASGQDSELYNQIAGQDMEAPVVKKKGRSPLVALMTVIMRFTLWIDSMRRTHERFFRALGVLWTFFMAILYFSGVLVLIFAIYNRLQLPIYLEDQLRARNVQFETAEYGMDRILVRNLKDKEGSYTVDTMVIYSTFTDLLQKRIRLVTLDGLNILVDTKSDFNLLKDAPKLLTQIQNPTRGRLDVAVNALTVNNAKLTFQNQQIDIPISFSMEGIYGDKTQIVVPLSINRPSLQAKATLTISGDTDYPEWTMTVSEGLITLPRSAPENLTGNLKLSLDHQDLKTIQADFKLGYGTIEKHVTANFTYKEDNSLSGQVNWEKNNLTEPSLSSQLAFDILHLTLSNTGDIYTSGPLTITSKQLNLSDFGVTGLHAPLNADVHCRGLSYCTVALKENASITIQNLWAQYQRERYHTTETLVFTLEPQEEAFVMREQNPYILFQLPIQNLALEAAIDESEQKLIIEGSRVFLTGALADDTSDASRLSIDAKNLLYKTPALSFENAELKVDNLLQNTSNVQMNARNVQLPSIPLLANPFHLNLVMVGLQTNAQINFDSLPFNIQLNGKFSIPHRAFVGQIRIPPFDLLKLTVPVQSLWPAIPASFRNFSGQVAIAGQLKWGSAHSISGPLNIGLRDVSFDTDNASISGLNTVLTLNSLQPFITQANQHIHVQSIKGLIPFQNLDILFQQDAQNLRLNQVSVMGAGVPLSLPPSVISTKNPNVLVYLKNNQPITPEQFHRAGEIKNIDITAGIANLSVPLEIQNNIVKIPNVTLKMQNVLLQRQTKDYENIFDSSDNYFIRSGQIIMDSNRVLQLVLNGRLLPERVEKDVQLNDIKLPETFFNALPQRVVPQDIQRRLETLFQQLTQPQS